MPNFRISKSRYSADQHAAWFEAFFPKAEGNDRLRAPLFEPGPDVAWFAATANPFEVAGFASIHRTSKRTAHLDSCAVWEAYRGQGLQAKLLARRIAWARALGITELTTVCQADNLVSLRNLIRVGFEPTYSRVFKQQGEDVMYFDLTAQLGKRGAK